MRSNQIAGIYGSNGSGVGSMPGPGSRAPVTQSGGKKFVSGNVNVSKPANQKEALQMLNNMMH